MVTILIIIAISKKILESLKKTIFIVNNTATIEKIKGNEISL